MSNVINLLLLMIFLVLFTCDRKPKENTKEKIIVDSETYQILKPKEKRKKKLPKDISKFIPDSYAILDAVYGDLNLDKKEDLILVLKKNGEDTLSDVVDNPEKRPLLILLSDMDNKLHLVKRNDNTVYCIDCGGMMGDPYMGITIKNGYFSVEHYGGSAWRWTRIITYKYSKVDKDWLLHKDGSEGFHIGEPDTIWRSVETSKDFGKVKFEDFDIYNEK